VLWIDPTRSQIALYPGKQNPPPSGLPQGPTMVPTSARRNLLATFNSGFYLSTPYGAQPGAVHEGFAVNGHVYSPFVRGLATLVVTSNGGVDITAWSGGSKPPPSDVVARQNLPLLVDHGAPTPAAGQPSVWGATLNGVPAVDRTALGVDRAGNLLYVSAPSQTAASLARILVHVGAVRAMELDINPEWPVAIVYRKPGGRSPRMLFPNYQQTPGVFLSPGMKDFFAVYLRDPGTSPGREPF
jgi:hypothetical protein